MCNNVVLDMSNNGKGKGFSAIEEEDEQIKNHATECGAVLLSIIAPFAPLRVGPKRVLFAQFSHPDEFVLEDFIEKLRERYPEKDKRPPLHLLIHSLGGTMSSSYMAAKILRENFNQIIGFVPHIAASGATVLALSCNKIVMGDISQLSGIDPHYESENGEINYALSTVRAFDKLQADLGTQSEDDISYPYRHLMSSITAEKYDQATHSMYLADKYAKDLMKDAGYNDTTAKKVVHSLLYEVDAHEEVIPIDRAQEIGVNACRFEEANHGKCWNIAKSWLRKYYLEPSPLHIIKYCFPQPIPTVQHIVQPVQSPDPNANKPQITVE
jgi:serine dehydrogenase proteinase